MIAKKTILAKDEIVIGEPIPWGLVNDQGIVLFKKGFIFNSQLSTQHVLELRLWHILQV